MSLGSKLERCCIYIPEILPVLLGEQDAKLILRDYEYSLPSNIAAIFPGLEVHTGFQQQFKAVAIVPNTTALDVGATLDSQMNGMMPERVSTHKSSWVICMSHRMSHVHLILPSECRRHFGRPDEWHAIGTGKNPRVIL